MTQANDTGNHGHSRSSFVLRTPKKADLPLLVGLIYR
jgi:hypothetical protein